MCAKLTVRPMGEMDAAAVAELEQRIFSDAWSENSILQTLKARPTLAFVAEVDDAFVGYFLGMQLFEEAEVYRIAVEPTGRKAGVGGALMEAFLQESAARGAENWSLEVRSQNEPALALYHRYDFVKESVRPHYYHNPEDDAWILWRRLTSNSPLENETISL